MRKDKAVISRWKEILEQHLIETPLAQKEDAWIYKLKLAELVPIPGYWERKDGLIRMFQNGQKHLISLVEIMSMPVIATIIRPRGGYSDGEPTWNEATPALLGGDMQSYLPQKFGSAIFAKRFVEKIYWLDRDYVSLFWRKGDSSTTIIDELPDETKLLYSISMSYGSLVGMTSTSMSIGIFNKKHPFVHWLFRFREACLKGDFNLDIEQFDKLFNHFRHSSFSKYTLKSLENYLIELGRIPGLPDYLKPPNLELTPEMFYTDLPTLSI